jgi:hypothetical protein
MSWLLQNSSGLDANTKYRKPNLISHNLDAYQCRLNTALYLQAMTFHHSVPPKVKLPPGYFLHLHNGSPQLSLGGGGTTIATNSWTGHLASFGADSHGLGH